jgi:hypothetical protein
MSAVARPAVPQGHPPRASAPAAAAGGSARRRRRRRTTTSRTRTLCWGVGGCPVFFCCCSRPRCTAPSWNISFTAWPPHLPALAAFTACSSLVFLVFPYPALSARQHSHARAPPPPPHPPPTNTHFTTPPTSKHPAHNAPRPAGKRPKSNVQSRLAAEEQRAAMLAERARVQQERLSAQIRRVREPPPCSAARPPDAATRRLLPAGMRPRCAAPCALWRFMPACAAGLARCWTSAKGRLPGPPALALMAVTGCSPPQKRTHTHTCTHQPASA